jgi:hypothetical protein
MELHGMSGKKELVLRTPSAWSLGSIPHDIR